jgi:hypothetical protein
MHLYEPFGRSMLLLIDRKWRVGPYFVDQPVTIILALVLPVCQQDRNDLLAAHPSIVLSCSEECWACHGIG